MNPDPSNPAWRPNNSTAMIVHASGVLVAPANTATKPSAANKSTGAPSSHASVFPNAAPIKNSGVTSPPLKPALRVTAVKRIFHHQLNGIAPPILKQDKMETPPGVCGSVATPNPK